MSEHRRVREIFENEYVFTRLRALTEGERQGPGLSSQPGTRQRGRFWRRRSTHTRADSPSVSVWVEGHRFEAIEDDDGWLRLR